MDRSPFRRWIFTEFTSDARSLGIYRILFAATLLLFEFPRNQWIPLLPASAWIPPAGLGAFFPAPPPAPFFWALHALNVTLALLLLVGWRTWATGLALAAGLLLANTFEFGFGKINHSILLLVTLLTLTFCDWGREFSWDASRRREPADPPPAWPLALLALVIAFAMFTAAVPKARSGWLDPELLCTRGHVILNYYGANRPTALGEFALLHFPDWAWKWTDWLSVALEAAFLPAMFSRHAFRLVCLTAILFHAVIGFMMDIIFWENVVVYAAFFAWSNCLPDSPRAATATARILGRVPVGLFVIAGLALAGGLRLARGTVGPVDAEPIGLVMLVLSTLFAVGTVGVLTWRRVTAARQPAAPPVILFDGFCGLCDHFVNFVMSHDRRGVFRYAALQSPAGVRLLEAHGLAGTGIDSVVFVSAGGARCHSAATLSILSRLGWPWKLAGICWLVPPLVRDCAYDFVAARRYRWFGRHDACRLPTPAERQLFLPDSA